MNLNQLRYAIEVERCGSISKAAKFLYVSQPGISNALKDLEDELGITIFQRKPTGVEVTGIGKLFLEEAKMILRQTDELNLKFRSADHKHGSLTISGITCMSCFLAVAASAEYLMNEKESSITYRSMDPFQTIDSVESGETDIGVISFYSTLDAIYKALLERNALQMHTFAEIPMFIVVRKGHPLALRKNVTFKDLNDYPLLTSESKDQMQIYHAISLSKNGELYQKPSRVITSDDQLLQEYVLTKLDAYALFSIKDKDNDGLPEGLVKLTDLPLDITENRAWIARADHEFTLAEDYFVSKLTEYFL